MNTPSAMCTVPAVPSHLAIDTPYAITPGRWSFADALFIRGLAEGVGPSVLQDRFPARSDLDLNHVTALGEPVALHDAGGGSGKALLRLRDTLVLVAVSEGFVDLAVAGSIVGARDVAEAVQASLGADMPPSGQVPVTFWWLSCNGPRSRQRTIEVPEWSSIARNYASTAAATLDRLMHSEHPPETGRLLLWHGPPGTGKSFAIRALIDAWRKWCAASFVTDPDRLFSASAEYLASLMIAEDHGYRRPWRLLILEDAGELMSVDARERSGSGLSRLLNLSDGILGQGSRTLILITTNEPLARLHPAVHRAGRCWAEVELPPLPMDEANAWLAERGRSQPVSAATPLAELFAPPAVRSAERRTIGFAA